MEAQEQYQEQIIKTLDKIANALETANKLSEHWIKQNILWHAQNKQWEHYQKSYLEWTKEQRKKENKKQEDWREEDLTKVSGIEKTLVLHELSIESLLNMWKIDHLPTNDLFATHKQEEHPAEQMAGVDFSTEEEVLKEEPTIPAENEVMYEAETEAAS